LTAVEQQDGKLLVKYQAPRKSAEVIDLLAVSQNANVGTGVAGSNGVSTGEVKPLTMVKVAGEGEVCEKCGKGKMVLRKSFHGPFLGCNNYPECKTIKPLSRDEIIAIAKESQVANAANNVEKGEINSDHIVANPNSNVSNSVSDVSLTKTGDSKIPLKKEAGVKKSKS
jgi:ssDNA-binding Zn-finger/Zn-ribbon topoisomerase 1